MRKYDEESNRPLVRQHHSHSTTIKIVDRMYFLVGNNVRASIRHHAIAKSYIKQLSIRLFLYEQGPENFWVTKMNLRVYMMKLYFKLILASNYYVCLTNKS